MIALRPDLKVMLASKPVDFRNYVERRIMRSTAAGDSDFSFLSTG